MMNDCYIQLLCYENGTALRNEGAGSLFSNASTASCLLLWIDSIPKFAL